MTVEFDLGGQRFVDIKVGRVHLRRGRLVPGHLRDQGGGRPPWERLSEGGKEGPWRLAKGPVRAVSWQAVPAGMEALLTDPDPQPAQPAIEAMLEMSKLDLATRRAAADGVRPT